VKEPSLHPAQGHAQGHAPHNIERPRSGYHAKAIGSLGRANGGGYAQRWAGSGSDAISSMAARPGSWCDRPSAQESRLPDARGTPQGDPGRHADPTPPRLPQDRPHSRGRERPGARRSEILARSPLKSIAV
jgi:hypothetical protein